MTPMEIRHTVRLAGEALQFHKQTGMCERPHTCGGCHWWQGYLAALEATLSNEMPTVTHPALQRASERLEHGKTNHHRFNDRLDGIGSPIGGGPAQEGPHEG